MFGWLVALVGCVLQALFKVPHDAAMLPAVPVGLKDVVAAMQTKATVAEDKDTAPVDLPTGWVNFGAWCQVRTHVLYAGARARCACLPVACMPAPGPPHTPLCAFARRPWRLRQVVHRARQLLRCREVSFSCSLPEDTSAPSDLRANWVSPCSSSVGHGAPFKRGNIVPDAAMQEAFSQCLSRCVVRGALHWVGRSRSPGRLAAGNSHHAWRTYMYVHMRPHL